jgi:hypothetical protein
MASTEKIHSPAIEKEKYLMRLTLTPLQAQKAVRDYLADPDDDESEAVRIPDSMPIRIAAARGGGIVVYTGVDAKTKPDPEP